VKSIPTSRIPHPHLGPSHSVHVEVHPLVKLVAVQIGIALVVLLTWAVLFVVR
jgi:hypothetical protein